jgi:hypothetical protein
MQDGVVASADDAMLREVADRLYGLPPEEFVRARNAAAATAKQDDQRALATRISKLGKPTVTAWLMNQVVRERPPELDELFQLGGRMREATTSLRGSDIRELSAERRPLIQALVERAQAVAEAAGRSFTADAARGIEDTLRGALADQAAAATLAAGCLNDVIPAGGLSGDYAGLAGWDADALSSSAPSEPSGARPEARSEPASAADADRAEEARTGKARLRLVPPVETSPGRPSRGRTPALGEADRGEADRGEADRGERGEDGGEPGRRASRIAADPEARRAAREAARAEEARRRAETEERRRRLAEARQHTRDAVAAVAQAERAQARARSVVADAEQALAAAREGLARADHAADAAAQQLAGARRRVTEI